MNKKYIITISLLLVFIFVWFLIASFYFKQNLDVYFLDVGQGDSIFIETPNKFQILVDGGPDNKVLSELSSVMPFYDKSIDILVISHPQNDHILGLVEVLKRYDVSNVIFSDVLYKNEAFYEIKKIIKEKNINIIKAQAGKRINIEKGTYIDIVYPFKDISGYQIDDINNISVSFILTYFNNRFLFSGDAELKEELDLVNSGLDIDVDVLKVNHHGSNTSSSNLFLKKTSPKIAVISVGKNNRYKHPSDLVLQRLKEIKVLRTDILGRIKISSDGVNLNY